MVILASFTRYFFIGEVGSSVGDAVLLLRVIVSIKRFYSQSRGGPFSCLGFSRFSDKLSTFSIPLTSLSQSHHNSPKRKHLSLYKTQVHIKLHYSTPITIKSSEVASIALNKNVANWARVNFIFGLNVLAVVPFVIP